MGGPTNSRFPCENTTLCAFEGKRLHSGRLSAAQSAAAIKQSEILMDRYSLEVTTRLGTGAANRSATRAGTGFSDLRVSDRRANNITEPKANMGDVVGKINDLGVAIAELARGAEAQRIIGQVEQQLPFGEQAELLLSQYRFGKGFDAIRLNPTGTEYWGNDLTGLPILRGTVHRVLGKSLTSSNAWTELRIKTQNGEIRAVADHDNPHSPLERFNRGESVRVDQLDKRARDYLNGRLHA